MILARQFDVFFWKIPWCDWQFSGFFSYSVWVCRNGPNMANKSKTGVLPKGRCPKCNDKGCCQTVSTRDASCQATSDARSGPRHVSWPSGARKPMRSKLPWSSIMIVVFQQRLKINENMWWSLVCDTDKCCISKGKTCKMLTDVMLSKQHLLRQFYLEAITTAHCGVWETLHCTSTSPWCCTGMYIWPSAISGSINAAVLKHVSTRTQIWQ